MTDKDTIVLREKMYIPATTLDSNTVAKKYIHFMYDHRVCSGCDNKPERHNYLCDQCPAFKGRISTCNRVIKNNIEYVGVPIGDRLVVEKKLGISFDDYNFVDKRVKQKFRYDIKLRKSFKLRDYQEKAVREWNEYKHGLIVAPPRSGKCVTADTYIQTEFGTITIDELFAGLPEPMPGSSQYFKRRFDILSSGGIRVATHIYRSWVNQTNRITTEHGFSIRGVSEHPLLVFTSEATYVWKNMVDIEIGDYICVNQSKSIFSYDNYALNRDCLPCYENEKGITYPKVMNTDLSSILGYLYAVGSMTDSVLTFTFPNRQVQADFVSHFGRCFGIKPEIEKNICFCESKLLCSVLHMYGADNALIPYSVLESGVDVVRSFLTAYFSCVVSYRDNIEIISSNKDFIDQLQVVLTNFGVISSQTKRQNHIDIESSSVGACYVLSVCGKHADKFYIEFSSLQNKRHDSTSGIIPYMKNKLREVVPYNSPLFTRLQLHKNEEFEYNDFYSSDINDLYKINSPLSSTIELIQDLNLFFSKVTSNDFIDEEVLVYDVTVPEGSHYLGNGIVSHNTPTLLSLAIDLGYRTIVLAHQHDFLKQFVDHIEEFTNLPYLEKKYGKKLYGFPKKLSDFNDFEICVCTYQQFITQGRGDKRLQAAIPNFGTLAVDEVHKANSNTFAAVVSKWPAKIKIGVTATDQRKDKREFIIKELIGPVVARVEIPQLVAKILIHSLDYVKPRSAYRGPAGFTYACQFLAKHEKRNNLILEYVKKDVENGHCIVIPVIFRDHVDFLVGAINEMLGKKVAQAFVGGSGKKNKEMREGIIEDARSRKIRVVVGIRSLLQLGLNVPAWSALYYVMPMSNEPNWKQESSRILTPDSSGEKRQPIIRMFVDPNVGLSLGCWANTYRQSIAFLHRPTDESRKIASELYEKHGGKHKRNNNDDPYAENASSGSGDPYEVQPSKQKHEATPREKRLSLKDRANSKTPVGLFNRR